MNYCCGVMTSNSNLCFAFLHFYVLSALTFVLLSQRRPSFSWVYVVVDHLFRHLYVGFLINKRLERATRLSLKAFLAFRFRGPSYRVICGGMETRKASKEGWVTGENKGPPEWKETKRESLWKIRKRRRISLTHYMTAVKIYWPGPTCEGVTFFSFLL